ncbi:MAG TPA: M20/M25/M40 family metallo-hydrolase [Solirubrobacteraceae bacterium]|nr:M20/M25/M40 family metallo-hydrolase [Solirubrobacteraceae bacterium]
MSVALDDAERRRLGETFRALCRIPSPTGSERGVADWLTAELGALGLAVSEDDAGRAAGADAGNLLVRIPGRSERWIVLCAHMDTVPPVAPLEPVLSGGGYQNAQPGILGADNKAAVAALVEVARRYAHRPPPVGIELLFTISEETGLHGAKAFDVARLNARMGYVFDHATPLGEIVVVSPTYMRIRADIRGRAAHAGLHPERGVNAIVAAAAAITALPQGRLDAETTANVGLVSGGSATNVVADRCQVECEVRGIDPSRVDSVVTQSVDAFQDAADGAGCDLDIQLERMFGGYRVRPGEPTLVLAERALSDLGYTPRRIISGGGSDANALRLAGLEVMNLANGTERAHERTERVSLTALEDGLALALNLVELA